MSMNVTITTFQGLDEWVDAFMKQKGLRLLFLVGNPGASKSHSIKTKLDAEQHHYFKCGRLTAFQLFKQLWRYRNKDIILDDVLAKRDQINQVLRLKLDEVTERWGVKVTTVEIREITPPKDVQEAMTRQMSAERSRRALVTEADGKKQAAITIAEGAKQAAILNAEGDRQAAILRAEGFALALDKIFSIAKTVDSNTMSLQYLEALKALGAGPATKFIFPMEFTRLLQPFLEYAGRSYTSPPKTP